jgi:hypothetical protein
LLFVNLTNPFGAIQACSINTNKSLQLSTEDESLTRQQFAECRKWGENGHSIPCEPQSLSRQRSKKINIAFCGATTRTYAEAASFQPDKRSPGWLENVDLIRWRLSLAVCDPRSGTYGAWVVRPCLREIS